MRRVLLDIRAHVVALNAIAPGCLGDGPVLAAERLQANDRTTDQRLQSMIGSFLEWPERQNAGTRSVAVRRRARLPLVVRLISLNQEAEEVADPLRLLLPVLDPEHKQEPSPEILTQTFDLTDLLPLNAPVFG
jgi:hypothetical protein